MTNLAGIHRAKRQFDEAERGYRRALDVYTSRSGTDSPQATTTLLNLAVLLSEQGRDGEALPLAHKAFEIRTRTHGAGDIRVASSLTLLADLNIKRGRLQEAHKLLDEWMAVRRDKIGAEPVAAVSVIEKLADVHRRQGRNSDAARLLEQAIHTRTSQLGAGHISIVWGRSQLAQVYRVLGRHADAEREQRLYVAAGRDKVRELPIFVGTNRKPKPNSTVASFGGEYSELLTMGRATVAVTRSASIVQRLTGSSSDDSQAFEPLEEGADATAASIRSFTAEQPAALVTAASQRMRASQAFRDQALVFVHGFNVSFEESVSFAGQFAYNLNFNGSVFLYTWPTSGGIFGYFADQNSARASSDHLVKFLQDVVAKTQARKVHFVAHSMGNRVLLDALEKIAGQPTADAIKIGEVLLASPDVDRVNFVRLMRKVRQLSGPVTLYTSASDWALWASRRLAGDSAGYFTAKDGPLVTEGVYTIDITDAGKKVWALNHSAFASNQRLLLDIRLVLERGEHPPDKRSNRFEVKSGPAGQSYWSFTAK